MAMSTRPDFSKIPPWNPKPPKNKPIGGKKGRFDVIEFTVYFDYVSDGRPEQERHFEMTIRVPMTKANTRIWTNDFWGFVAAVKMEQLHIYTQGPHWDESIVGYRDVGRTNSYLPIYFLINKQAHWTYPDRGRWDTIRMDKHVDRRRR